MPSPFESMRYAMNVILKNGVPQEWDGSITVTSLNPLEKYKISNMPASAETEDDVQYYGFIDSDGGWYILELTTSTGTCMYAKGVSDYLTAWTNKESLVYTYFDLTF